MIWTTCFDMLRNRSKDELLNPQQECYGLSNSDLEGFVLENIKCCSYLEISRCKQTSDWKKYLDKVTAIL